MPQAPSQRFSQNVSTLFPIGEMEKKDVRALAAKYELEVATKKDSTGVCFIGERNFKEFLMNYIPANPGDIVNTKGEVVGRHDGVMYYTIGQRHGFVDFRETLNGFSSKRSKRHS